MANIPINFTGEYGKSYFGAITYEPVIAKVLERLIQDYPLFNQSKYRNKVNGILMTELNDKCIQIKDSELINAVPIQIIEDCDEFNNNSLQKHKHRRIKSANIDIGIKIDDIIESLIIDGEKTKLGYFYNTSELGQSSLLISGKKILLEVLRPLLGKKILFEMILDEFPARFEYVPIDESIILVSLARKNINLRTYSSVTSINSPSYYNPQTGFIGIYISYNIYPIFLGDTIIEFSGDSSFNGSVSAETFYSGGTNLLKLIQDAYFTGNTSGNCINEFYVSNLYGCSPITLHDDIIPVTDDTINLGSSIQRFRQINTVSGMSTVWTSTTSVTTAMLDLGLDSGGNLRQITANNSIIQNDILDGDIY
jgi:hypothetical protein